MNEDKRAQLLICAHLLSYPSEHFVEEVNELEKKLLSNSKNNTIKQNVKNAYKKLFRLTSRERQELYVTTFDLKASLGLYLTAHEFGDSTKRGSALIKLQKMINLAGFDRVEGELADYIPMLFEFLAVADETEAYTRLTKRLATVVQRMMNHIEKDHPYAAIFTFLMEDVFASPTKEEVEQLEYDREEADLDELPYPIMYQ